jgi:hypothetical protein
MPADAGIQEVVDNNEFKDLDSSSLLKVCRNLFRGNDGAFTRYDKSPTSWNP